MSVLYSQTSGEIKATFVQTYNTATELLEKAIGDSDWDAVLESEGKKNRTPAIILDVDAVSYTHLTLPTMIGV